MFHQAGRGQVYGILCARTSMWSRDPGPKFRRKVRLSFIYYLFLFLFFIFCFCDYFDVFLIVCLLSWFTYPPFLAYTLSSSLLPTHSVSLSLFLSPPDIKDISIRTFDTVRVCVRTETNQNMLESGTEAYPRASGYTGLWREIDT